MSQGLRNQYLSGSLEKISRPLNLIRRPYGLVFIAIPKMACVPVHHAGRYNDYSLHRCLQPSGNEENTGNV